MLIYYNINYQKINNLILFFIVNFCVYFLIFIIIVCVVRVSSDYIKISRARLDLKFLPGKHYWTSYKISSY